MNYDEDIGALLDAIIQGKEPNLDALDTPKPPPKPAQPAVLSHKDESEITLDDILPDQPDEVPDTSKEPKELRTLVIGPDTTDEQIQDFVEGSEVTTLVTEADESDQSTTDEQCDETLAQLPQIDDSMFSKPAAIPTIPMPTFTNDELMESLDIRNFGMLVSLSTQRWHAKVKDRKAAMDAAGATGADASAFEARKRLLVGADEKLKRVHKAIDAARTDHYRMTLPWSTVGINDQGKRAGRRLLPNTLFFEYTKTMGKHKLEMQQALGEFIQAYPTLIAISQQKLGGSFNQGEYPPPSSIGRYFDLSFDFDPIPTGGDFENVQLQQADKLASALNKKTKVMLENAMQDAWVRLYEDIEHAVNVLKNPDAMFHYTLVEKLREHSSMLSHLNVTKDPRIEAIRKKIETNLCRWDVKEIRKDDQLRRRLGEAAEKVHGLMKEYAA